MGLRGAVPSTVKRVRVGVKGTVCKGMFCSDIYNGDIELKGK